MTTEGIRFALACAAAGASTATKARTRTAARAALLIFPTPSLPGILPGSGDPTAIGSGELAERRQEALVLGVLAVGDPDVAGASERGAGPDRYAGPGERLDHLALVEFA